jgi:putative chitobiose transport system substrate-binding protein
MRGLAGAVVATAAAMVPLSAGSCGRADADATTTVEFWTISLKPVFTEFIESRCAAFEDEHPGVDVRWVDVPFGAIERKFIAAAAAGRAPDVVNLSDLMFARFAAAGAFLDLDTVLTAEDFAAYAPGALRVGVIGGERLALPWYLTTQSMIVNVPLLESGGLTLETVGRSWGELAAQAPAFHERTGRYLFTQPLGQDSQLLIMMLGDGIVPFVEERGPDGTARLRADLTRPEVLSFLRMWVEVYRAGAMPREAATNGFEHLIDVYQNERAAVLNTGANFLGRIRGVSERVFEQTEVLPPIVGSLGRAHIAVMPVCVSATTDEPELAAAFARFITNADNQLAFSKLAPILPSTPEALADEFFAGPTDREAADGKAKEGEARAITAGALREGYAFTATMDCWPELRRAFENGMKRVLLSDAEPDLAGVMASVNAEWDRIMAEADERRAAAGAGPMTLKLVPTPAALPARSRSGAGAPR